MIEPIYLISANFLLIVIALVVADYRLRKIERRLKRIDTK